MRAPQAVRKEVVRQLLVSPLQSEAIPRVYSVLGARPVRVTRVSYTVCSTPLSDTTHSVAEPSSSNWKVTEVALIESKEGKPGRGQSGMTGVN